jgi:prepilin-type N-terminal cleavage/methylation domain-containing protein
MEFMRKRRSMAGQAGLTLIEMLVVMALLGILSGVAAFVSSGITESGELGACRSEKNAVRGALGAAEVTAGTWEDHIDSGAPATQYWEVTGGAVVQKSGVTPPAGC